MEHQAPTPSNIPNTAVVTQKVIHAKNWKKSELNMLEQVSPISLETLQLQNFTHSLLHLHHAKVQMSVVFSGGLRKFIQEPQLRHLDLQT
jgi:hypothetical protein